MLCTGFEENLTNYLDGTLSAGEARLFAEHAMRCPVCHETLNGVKKTVLECRSAEAPAAPKLLEERILAKTVPQIAMACPEFEEYLTDYLDGFLPAPLYHRWERHAAICDECTDLPGYVVRSIGACYSYMGEELEIPEGLNERILRETLGTAEPRSIRAPLVSRIKSAMRRWLDLVVSPQLATVATMLLVAVLVGTSTISDDGSIGGMYRASFRLAAQTYARGANTAKRTAALSNDLKRVAGDLEQMVSNPDQNSANPSGNKQQETGK